MRNPHPYLQSVASKIRELREELDGDLALERSVPEDADMTRNESTLISLAYLSGAVEVLRVLPESAQEQVLALLEVESVDTLVPDLSEFDPWADEQEAA